MPAKKIKQAKKQEDKSIQSIEELAYAFLVSKGISTHFFDLFSSCCSSITKAIESNGGVEKWLEKECVLPADLKYPLTDKFYISRSSLRNIQKILNTCDARIEFNKILLDYIKNMDVDSFKEFAITELQVNRFGGIKIDDFQEYHKQFQRLVLATQIEYAKIKKYLNLNKEGKDRNLSYDQLIQLVLMVNTLYVRESFDAKNECVTKKPVKTNSKGHYGLIYQLNRFTSEFHAIKEIHDELEKMWCNKKPYFLNFLRYKRPDRKVFCELKLDEFDEKYIRKTLLELHRNIEFLANIKSIAEHLLPSGSVAELLVKNQKCQEIVCETANIKEKFNLLLEKIISLKTWLTASDDDAFWVLYGDKLITNLFACTIMVDQLSSIITENFNEITSIRESIEEELSEELKSSLISSNFEDCSTTIDEQVINNKETKPRNKRKKTTLNLEQTSNAESTTSISMQPDLELEPDLAGMELSQEPTISFEHQEEIDPLKNNNLINALLKAEGKNRTFIKKEYSDALKIMARSKKEESKRIQRAILFSNQPQPKSSKMQDPRSFQVAEELVMNNYKDIEAILSSSIREVSYKDFVSLINRLGGQICDGNGSSHCKIMFKETLSSYILDTVGGFARPHGKGKDNKITGFNLKLCQYALQKVMPVNWQELMPQDKTQLCAP